MSESVFKPTTDLTLAHESANEFNRVVGSEPQALHGNQEIQTRALDHIERDLRGRGILRRMRDLFLGAKISPTAEVVVREDILWADKIRGHQFDGQFPQAEVLQRAYFEEKVQADLVKIEELHRRSTDIRAGMYVLCDMDNFKQINDTYGHMAGDLVLSSFVEATREVLRNTDILGRYGGDEFTLWLTDSSAEGLGNILLGTDNKQGGIAKRILLLANSKVAAKLRHQDVIKWTPQGGSDPPKYFDFSVGFHAIDSSSEAETFESIKRQADESLYAEKRRRKATD